MEYAVNPVVATLIEAGNVDTVYRDAYLDRARALLAPRLPLEEFQRLEQQRAAMAELPGTIARAVEAMKWSMVKDLSERAQDLKHTLDAKAAVLDAARGVYDVRDVRLDPFSPGLQAFTRITARALPALRTRVVELLGALQAGDAAWSEFYAARRRAFQTRAQTASDTPDAETAMSSSSNPLEAARQALKAGDMKRLSALAEVLIAAETPSASASPSAPNGAAAAATGVEVDLQPAAYSGETLAKARRLGLAPRHLELRLELASLRRYAWTPLSDERGAAAATRVTVPSGSPPRLKEELQMFAIHPLVNSGGARYLPSLVAEDVLVEDFPDPTEGQAAPPSELVKMLGLAGRRGLPRVAIEQALMMRGGRIVESELGLDSRVFRLVCIPPDVYVRLGQAEGWGGQPFWTHFDGYLVMPDGRLRALAGGDVRYGGLYELLAIGRDYDSDRTLARFAVVQRARMVAW